MSGKSSRKAAIVLISALLVLSSQAFAQENPCVFPLDAAKCLTAAEKGDAEAQNNLGWMYLTGQGVRKDYQQASHWIIMAAEQGLAKAQFSRGFIYANGRGVPVDNEQAVYWYRKAAEQGDPYGQHYLGIMYGFGKGVPKDYVQAYMWVSLSLEQFQEAAKLPEDKKNREPRPEAAAGNLHNRTEGILKAISSNMTPAQVEEAKKLAKEWDSP